MSEWNVSDAGTFFEVYRDEQTYSYSLLSESEAHQLAEELDELEALREERRWRKVGEEWPESGQDCILANSRFQSEVVTFGSEKTGWASSGHCGNCDSGGTDRFYGTDGKEKYAEYDYMPYTHWRPVPMDVPVAVEE